jgi:hypothetical protein
MLISVLLHILLHVSICMNIFRWLRKCTAVVIDFFSLNGSIFVKYSRYFRLNLDMYHEHILQYVKN